MGFLKIGHLVSIGFGLVLTFSLAMGLAGRLAYQVSQTQNQVIQRRNQADSLALQVQLLTLERTDTFRRYLETEDVRLRLTYQSQRAEYISSYNRLAQLLRTPDEAEALQVVFRTEEEFNNKVQETFNWYREGAIEEANQLWEAEGAAVGHDLTQATAAWSSVQARNSQLIIDDARQTMAVAVNLVTIFMVAAFLGGVFCSFLLTYLITRPITQLVKDTSNIDFDLTTRVKPSGPKEIAFLGTSLNQMAERLQEAKQALEYHHDQLEHELIAARDAQASFLPKTIPELSTLKLAAHWQPARETGGDFYTVIELEDHKLGVAVGDVVGKGAPAAIAGSLALGLLETQAVLHNSPDSLLATLQTLLHDRFYSKFLNVACCYATIDPANLRLSVANAGLIVPYLCRDQVVSQIDVIGMPLGVMPRFDYQAQSITLQAGDLILLSSDGLVETQNLQGEFFGFERLESALLELPQDCSPQTVIDHLVQKAAAFMGAVELYDDVTLIAIRVTDL